MAMRRMRQLLPYYSRRTLVRSKFHEVDLGIPSATPNRHMRKGGCNRTMLEGPGLDYFGKGGSKKLIIMNKPRH